MNWLALPASAAWKLEAGTIHCPTAEVSDRTSLSSDDIGLVQDMSRGLGLGLVFIYQIK